MVKYYLYGLQRSGTNVIQTFLEKNYDMHFSNDKNDRKSVKHKHFRIYDNKKYIPNRSEDSPYCNDTIVHNLDRLDIALNDKEHTNKYIIVYKRHIFMASFI